MPASLTDLQTIINDGATKNRVKAALAKTAVNINYEGGGVANHAARLAFAKTVLTTNPDTLAGQVVIYVIAAYALANPAAELAAITGMDDATLQNYVDAAAGVFAGG